MEDFNLPSSKDVDKFWIGVPGRVNIILQEKTTSIRFSILHGKEVKVDKCENWGGGGEYHVGK